MNKNLSEIWQKVTDLLEKEISSIGYSTWIKPLEPKSINNNIFNIYVSSDFQRDMVKTKYYTLIRNAIMLVTNKDYEINYLFKGQEEENTKENISNDSKNNAPTLMNLNQKYTFENFIIGNNNRFAHAAALAVAEKPGASYNPLFIYGGVGLGKTHLMQAIGHYVLCEDVSKKIIYVSAEQFSNELITAIMDNKNTEFRLKYRNIDVFLIDDIQFIAGKERSQEEFFNTFNALYESGKQIIVTSDKPPKDIQHLEDRLKSRFEMGLLVDIQAPDYETRLAILKKKAQSNKIIIEPDLLVTIATNVTSNIRELEGALNKIILYSSLTNSAITPEIVEKAIEDMAKNKAVVLNSKVIMQVVAKFFNVKVIEIMSDKRSNSIAYPRQIAMYLCREIASMQFASIGKDFGGKDHTTVLHAHNKIKKEIEENPETRDLIESIKKDLNVRG